MNIALRILTFYTIFAVRSLGYVQSVRTIPEFNKLAYG